MINQREGRPVGSFILTLPFLASVVVSPLWFLDAPRAGPDLATLWLLCLAATFALAAKYPRIDESSLWLWILVFLFGVGYFGKTAFVGYWMEQSEVMDKLNPDWEWITETDLVRGLRTSMLAMLVATGTALVFRQAPQSSPTTGQVVAQRLLVATVCVSAAVAGLSLLRSALGIGVMGVEGAELPLGIDTAIFRVQSAVLPAALIGLLWLAHNSRRPALYAAFVGLLALHFITLALVSASKAGVLNLIVLLVFFWLCTGAFTIRRLAIMGVLGVAAVVFFAVSNELRALRVDGLTLSEGFAALAEAGSVDVLQGMRAALRAIFLRVSGVDGLWFVTGQAEVGFVDLSRLDDLVKMGMVEYYTREIVGITWLQDFRAPGFVAAVALPFGLIGIFFLIPLLLAYAAFWRYLGRYSFHTPVRVYFGAFALQYLMEGTFRWQDFVAALFGMALMVVLLAWILGKPLGLAVRAVVSPRLMTQGKT